MGSIGTCCCGCVDETVLPTTVSFGTGAYAGTITNAEWSSTSFNGVVTPCCWFASKTFDSYLQPTIGRYEYQCSAPYGLPGGVIDQIFVSIRWKIGTYLILSKQTCQCDSQPSPVSQYILLVQDLYQIWTAAPYNFGGSCFDLAYAIVLRPLPRPPRFNSISQGIARKIYYPSAVTSSFIFTPGSTADCDDSCAQGGFGQNSMTVSLELSGITRSVTWEDTSDWTVDITY